MADTRVRKVAERIHETVAHLIDHKLKDPRLGMVTVTDVRVTGYLQHSTVFYTVFGSEKDLTNTAAALKSATGMIRSEVGRVLGIRLTPTLEFVPDALPASAQSLEDALTAARHRDAEIAKLAEGATHAGEADPYRQPNEADDADDDAAPATN